jgi:hypothetical protein
LRFLGDIGRLGKAAGPSTSLRFARDDKVGIAFLRWHQLLK